MSYYRYVKLPHKICQGAVGLEILKEFGIDLPPCPQAIVAHRNGKMIGFARFEMIGKHIWGGGVWTAPAERRLNLASQLWHKILKRYRPEMVTIRTVTPAGRGWVGNLIKNEDPRITWHVEV